MAGMGAGRTTRIPGGSRRKSPGGASSRNEKSVRSRPSQKLTFYRIDTKLEEDIALDDVGSIGRLRVYGERLAEMIDWEAILAGTDEEFRVRDDRALFPQYAKRTT